MKQSSWQMHHQRGSHRVWNSKKGFRLPVQDKNGMAKGYQVKQFLRQLEMEVQ
jgi:predicted RNA binding protein YcfA (HicA-like mRNA interferase family)